jgi:hypothetical protein
VIKEPDVVVHKAHEPDLLAALFDAEILSGEDGV